MGNRKVRNSILIVGVCLIAGWFVLNQIYFYNPFNFTSDKVTRGAWWWYKNPVTIKIVHYNKQKRTEDITISNKSEIKMVLNELKQGKQIGDYQVPGTFTNDQYVLELLSSNTLLFSGNGVPKDNVLALNHINPEAVTIQLSEPLKEYIAKKLRQTKPTQ